jgi:RNA polymerase sigma-70 factor (ECF subfamily)
MDTLEIEWDRLVEDLGPRLYRYFCASFSAASASDAVQETLVRLVQKCREGAYLSEKGSLGAYAFGIAHWVRLETLKKKRDFELVEDESIFDQRSAASSSDLEGQRAHLRWAIRQLKSPEQELVLLTIDAELGLAEISETLGLPLGTVKSHIHRAKENLRTIMEVQNERQRQ